jgi:hypothetical protein
MVATHSVVWNGKENKLYVSQGPALVGSFIGFDLKESFEKKDAIKINSLPVDVETTRDEYELLKELQEKLSDIKANLKANKLAEAKQQMDLAEEINVKSVALARQREG